MRIKPTPTIHVLQAPTHLLPASRLVNQRPHFEVTSEIGALLLSEMINGSF
jgi:hypothetical protein